MSLLDSVRARTLFATHFHELTTLRHEAISNLSMDVRDAGGEIVFLKRVREGPSSNSYGIHVARLAGLPPETIQIAERLLGEEPEVSMAPAPHFERERAVPGQEQLFTPQELVARQIAGLRIELMTPMEALTLLARLQQELGGGKAP